MFTGIKVLLVGLLVIVRGPLSIKSFKIPPTMFTNVGTPSSSSSPPPPPSLHPPSHLSISPFRYPEAKESTKLRINPSPNDPEDLTLTPLPPSTSPLGSNVRRLSALAIPTLLTIALPSVISLTDAYLASYTDLLSSPSSPPPTHISNLEVVSATVPYVNFVNFLFSASFAGTVVPSIVGGDLKDNPTLPRTLIGLAVKVRS